MTRRAGIGVLLGEVKTRSGVCVACGVRLRREDRIAWTWARQRIHEACMALYALADRGRRSLGAWVAEPVRSVLERYHGRMCDACLALALSTSLEEAREIIRISSRLPGFQVLPVTCDKCQRSVMALCLTSDARTEPAD